MDNKKLAKELSDIVNLIQCSGFFACPGSEGNRIYSMRTCANCAAVILLKRLTKKLKGGDT